MLRKSLTKRFFGTPGHTALTESQISALPNQLLINGKWVPSASGKTFDNLDPSTGKLLTKVASASADDVQLAVDSAKAAFKPWNEVPIETRSQTLHRFADNLAKHKDELVAIECTDQGKPAFQAGMDVEFSIKIFRYYASMLMTRRYGRSFERETGPKAGTFGYTRLEPIGQVGCITPWNFPILMTSFKMAPFLASGCTGIFKSPELAPMSSLKVASIWEQTEGSMPGVLNMLPGVGAEAGEAIVDHPGIKMLAFTGSTATGQRIMSRSAAHMKRLSLELGGKSPLIVFPDADIGKAAFLASLFGTISSGQFCGSPTRLFIHEQVHDEFVGMLSGIMSQQKIGRWIEPDVTNGPVISQNQLTKIMGYIDSGVKEGAQIVTGGNQIQRDGFFVEPTLFTGVTDEMKICKEEIFGPVLSVLKFSDIDEVIARANSSSYGLVGGVFSKNMAVCNKVMKELQCGVVAANTYFPLDVDTPFGGYKHSGQSRELSEEGLTRFMEPKTIVWDTN